MVLKTKEVSCCQRVLYASSCPKSEPDFRLDVDGLNLKVLLICCTTMKVNVNTKGYFLGVTLCPEGFHLDPGNVPGRGFKHGSNQTLEQVSL